MFTWLNGVRVMLVVIVAAIALGTLLTAYTASALSRQVDDKENNRRQLVNYVNDVFYRQKGTIIAKGRNATPVPYAGDLLTPYARDSLRYGGEPGGSVTETASLIGYRIERLTLSPPVAWDALPPNATWPIGNDAGQRTGTFDKVWRLTVTGGPFRVHTYAPPIDFYPQVDLFGWYIWLDDTRVGRGVEGNGGIMTIMLDPKLLREGAAVGVSGPGKTSYFPEKLHLVSPP